MNGKIGDESKKIMNPTINISTRMMGVIHHALLWTMKSINSANKPLLSFGICESDMENLSRASKMELNYECLVCHLDNTGRAISRLWSAPLVFQWSLHSILSECAHLATPDPRNLKHLQLWYRYLVAGDMVPNDSAIHVWFVYGTGFEGFQRWRG